MSESGHNRHGEDGATVWIHGLIQFLFGIVIVSGAIRLAKLWWVSMTKYEVKDGELILKSKPASQKPPEEIW